MPRLLPLARKLHRWLSYLVFLQLTLWILGGLTFAIVPFDSVIKGGAVLASKPSPDFPADWWQRLTPRLASMGSVQGLRAHDSSQGPLIELTTPMGSQWLRVTDGNLAVPPSASDIERFAASLYAGDGKATAVRYLDEPEYRYWGLVDELYGRTNVWQVSFDDGVETRLYFDGLTGRYLLLRNDFWVLYDAMWRLHIMDYEHGENFNNLFLRVLTPLAMLFAVSGLFLTANAAQRAFKTKRR